MVTPGGLSNVFRGELIFAVDRYVSKSAETRLAAVFFIFSNYLFILLRQFADDSTPD
jgi:hypothetical protein